jgi:enamine deaminase RidA (YjgF/YER057c/UK114 family)
VEQGYEAARLCRLNLLVNMIAAVGTLERVEGVLKVLGMVNAVPDFGQHPEVINGCTDLFVQVLGEGGRPARSAWVWRVCRGELRWRWRRLCWSGKLNPIFTCLCARLRMS